MPQNEDVRRSVLIVSSSEQFDMVAKRSLTGFVTMDIRRSGSVARRSLLERDYDLVIINAPLPDEMGTELALDIAEKSGASVLMVTPQDIYSDILERVTDAGILAIAKPFPKGRMDVAIRYLISVRKRIVRLEGKIRKTEEKMEELRKVSTAKLLLIEKQHMTEEEAHRFIGKEAMDHGVSRRRVAESIIEELG
ncbi:MAG: ANTAR domain-containing protein [Butyrivibrio sp.]|nr:ANTAR domain-containing protein [Butyrivibrio sp.]